MRVEPDELFIENLAGNISKKRALALLGKTDGEDFGYDVADRIVTAESFSFHTSA